MNGTFKNPVALFVALGVAAGYFLVSTFYRALHFIAMRRSVQAMALRNNLAMYIKEQEYVHTDGHCIDA